MMLSTVFLGVIGYLIDVRGDVSIHRRNATQASPASVGAEVHAGDTLRVKKNAKARILCPDLTTTWEPVPQTTSGVFERCSDLTERIRSRQEQQALGLRSADSAPWIRTPSNSAISTATPILRWEPIPRAVRYRVSLLENAIPRRTVWGPALVDGTSVRYAGREALVAGVEYVVRVEAEGGAEAEGKPFVIASEDVRTKIAARTRYFEQTIPEQTPRDLAMAIYLLNDNFRADALSLLDRLTVTEKSAAVTLLHARCLADAGDLGAQREALKRAIDEAVQTRDSYSEAEALLDLARISKQEDAERLSEHAARLLQTLGIQQPRGER